MHRTTIMLPEDLKEKAQQRADSRGISLGELVRECLSDRLALEAETRRLADPVFSAPAWEGEAPRDLGDEHDRYLYGSDE